MSVVTIEGTLSPAAGVLKRGEQATVTLTPRVKRLIKGGFVKVVGVHTGPGEGAPPPPQGAPDDTPDAPDKEPDDEPDDTPDEEDDDTPDEEDDVPDALDEPARNAKKEVWQEFLTDQNIQFPESASRDDLVAGWVHISQQRAGGS
jgi:hypothetical protein